MLDDIVKERKEKLKTLKEASINPYPAVSKRTHEIKEILDSFLSLEKSKKKISIVGRVRARRGQGKIAFMDLEDATGRMQIVLRDDKTYKFKDLVPNIDAGDF